MLKEHDIVKADTIIKDKDSDVTDLNKMKVISTKNMRIGVMII